MLRSKSDGGALGGGIYFSIDKMFDSLPAITCAQPSIELPTNATSATIKLAPTCLGAPVTRSQFCVFITGTSNAQDKSTAACWFFQ